MRTSHIIFIKKVSMRIHEYALLFLIISVITHIFYMQYNINIYDDRL